MFSGEKVLVDLRCDNSLMKTMVDRFGEDVTILAPESVKEQYRQMIAKADEDMQERVVIRK